VCLITSCRIFFCFFVYLQKVCHEKFRLLISREKISGYFEFYLLNQNDKFYLPLRKDSDSLRVPNSLQGFACSKISAYLPVFFIIHFNFNKIAVCSKKNAVQ